MRRCFFFLLLISIAFSNVFAVDRKELRVGIVDGYPMAFMDQDGKIKGFYVDMVNEMAKQENWEIQFYLENSNSLLQKLKNQEIDIFVGLGYSEERSDWIDYSSVVMLTEWCQLYTGKEPINSLTEIINKKSGIVKSTISGQKFKDLISSLNISTSISEFTSNNDLLVALDKGMVDVGVVNSIYGYNNEKNYNIRRSNIVFEPFGHYIGALRGKNEDLLKSMDLMIRKFKLDKSSVYYKSYSRWIDHGVSNNVIPLWIWQLMGLVLLVLLLVSGVALFLRNAVARATRELTMSNKQLSEENEKRRKAEAILRQSEEKYRLLTELSPDLIWTSDLKGKVNFISSAVKRVRGYTVDEYLKLPPEKVYSARTLKLLNTILQTEIPKLSSGEADKDQSISVEVEHLRKDGSMVWSELHIRAIYDEYGNPNGLMGITRDITERKKLEEDLQKNNAWLRLVFEATKDGIWEYDILKREITSNERGFEIVGASRNSRSMTMDAFQNICHPDDFTRTRIAALGCFEGKEEFYSDELRFKINNDWRWVRIRGKVVEYADLEKKQPAKMIGTLTDIHEAKQAEMKVHEEEQKFRLLAEYSPDYIWTSDLNWNYTYVSPSVSNRLGYAAEEFLAMPKDKLFTGESYQMAKEIFAREVKKVIMKEVPADHSVKLELQLYSKSKKLLWVEVNCRGLFDKNGNLIMVMGINRDITERKQAELELRESEERFMQFADNIDDICWLEDISGKVLFVNKAFEKIFKIPTQKVLEQTDIVTKFLTKKDADRFEKNLWDKSLNVAYETEYEIILADGSTHWIWLKRFPILDENGNLYRRAGIATDISKMKEIQFELEKANEKAQESDRLKTIFLTNITHELRTPINGIMGFGQLLIDSTKISDEQRMYLDVLLNSSRRLVSVINDLLDISKLEAGQLQLLPAPFVLNEVITEIYEEYKARLQQSEEKSSLKIELNADKSIGYINADEVRLRQILSNLIDNAIKFTITGSITIGCKLFKQQQYIEFFIKDTGIGVPEDKVEDIFQHFRQGEETLTREYEGTGLGLAICKGLVELMGGRIYAESRLNEGSTFYFTIPFADIQKPVTKTDKNAKKVYQWDKKQVLIVEDDPNSYFFLSTILGRTNVKIYHAKSGSHALELMKKLESIDLILMDIRLPDIDGLEVTKRIRKTNDKVVIVAQTAHTFNNDREICLSAGCNEYLMKPTSMHQLLDTMSKYLD